MKTIIYLTFIATLFSCTKPIAKSNQPIDKLQWLIGSWKAIDKNGTSTEVWKRSNDSTYNATSGMPNKDGKTVPFENIELVYKNNRYYYIVTAVDQNDNKPITFAIAKISRNGFVAENMQHDFPKRISYKLINKDSIQASIDDGLPKPKKIYYFNFSK
jgi:hypothetical protein